MHLGRQIEWRTRGQMQGRLSVQRREGHGGMSHRSTANRDPNRSWYACHTSKKIWLRSFHVLQMRSSVANVGIRKAEKSMNTRTRQLQTRCRLTSAPRYQRSNCIRPTGKKLESEARNKTTLMNWSRFQSFTGLIMRLFSFLLEMLQTREDIVLQQVLDKQDKMIQKKNNKKLFTFTYFWIILSF